MFIFKWHRFCGVFISRSVIRWSFFSIFVHRSIVMIASDNHFKAGVLLIIRTWVPSSIRHFLISSQIVSFFWVVLTIKYSVLTNLLTQKATAEKRKIITLLYETNKSCTCKFCTYFCSLSLCGSFCLFRTKNIRMQSSTMVNALLLFIAAVIQ